MKRYIWFNTNHVSWFQVSMGEQAYPQIRGATLSLLPQIPYLVFSELMSGYNENQSSPEKTRNF